MLHWNTCDATVLFMEVKKHLILEIKQISLPFFICFLQGELVWNFCSKSLLEGKNAA